MGSPSSSMATLRPELGMGLVKFDLALDRLGFIGHRVLPVKQVSKQAGPFGVIGLEQLLENADTERAPGAPYSRGEWTFTKDSYATAEHGREEPVDDRHAAMYSDFFNHEQISAARALDAVLRNAEKRIAALIFNATTWTGSALTTGPTHEWDDATNAVPVTDVKNAALRVWNGCGMWPNALILNRKVFLNLRECNQIRDRIASAGAGESTKARQVTLEQIAQCFDLPYILVAGGAQNTANKGQTAAISQIWSDEYAMVAKIAETDDPAEPCLGRTLHWSEDGSDIGGTVESYRDESRRADIIRVRHDVQEKVIYAQCAHLISNVTTI
jgi:hypothetical protein